MNHRIPKWGPRRTAAFTLVEVLFGIFIVTLGSTATISLLTFGRLHNAEQQERARAHQIVTQEMENLRGELFPLVQSSQQLVVWDNGTPLVLTDDTPGTLTITIWDGAGNQLTSMPIPWERVQIEVTLAWNGRGRRADTQLRESLMTYVAPK